MVYDTPWNRGGFHACANGGYQATFPSDHVAWVRARLLRVQMSYTSSITTPKDAHKRLVLQVYLGSNTSRLEFSTIKTLPSREELDISLSIVNSKACFYTHALHALLAWSALARCLLLHGCEIKSGSCLGTRLPLFLDCWWTKVSFLHHGTKPICTQIWDPIWPVY